MEPVADVVDPSSVNTGRLAPATFRKPVEGLINWPPLVTFVFAESKSEVVAQPGRDGGVIDVERSVRCRKRSTDSS